MFYCLGGKARNKIWSSDWFHSVVRVHLKHANQASFILLSILSVWDGHAVNKTFPTRGKKKKTENQRKYEFKVKNKFDCSASCCFLSSKLVCHPLLISESLLSAKYNSRKQNQQDLALRVLGQQLVPGSAGPAGSESHTPQTDAVRAAGRSSRGREQAWGHRQRLTARTTETGYRLHVILKMSKTAQASHKRF